jgi:hypothetical protein
MLEIASTARRSVDGKAGMSTVMGGNIEAVLTSPGRAWAWILVFGVISILVGLAAIF